jgi:hypothetical protein
MKCNDLSGIRDFLGYSLMGGGGSGCKEACTGDGVIELFEVEPGKLDLCQARRRGTLGT